MATESNVGPWHNQDYTLHKS